MKLNIALLLAAILSVTPIMIGCSPTAHSSQSIPTPDQSILAAYDSTITGSANEFGFKLLSQLFTDHDNILLSPISIATALAMTYNGAREETRQAMADTLGIVGIDLKRLNENNLALLYLLQSSDPTVKLKLGNSLWMRDSIEFDDEFVSRNEQFYNAQAKTLDFDASDAADTINNWVLDRTGGMIKDMIIPPIHPLTILFLINAAYFNGTWTEPFNEAYTRDDIFYNATGDTISTPFMFSSGPFPYYSQPGLQAVRLPYGEDGRFAMYVFLPDETSTVEQLVKAIPDVWDNRDALETERLDLFLPKFSFAYEQSLNDSLTALGMGIAFDDTRADFFDMVPWEGAPRLYISEVKHKSFITVDEQGTKAAAATSVEIKVESSPIDPLTIRVNRPFLFLIHDQETDAILFTGVVNSIDDTL